MGKGQPSEGAPLEVDGKASRSLDLSRGMEIVARVSEQPSLITPPVPESMLHTIIRSMQGVVLLFDRDLRIIEASKPAISALRLPRDPRGTILTAKTAPGIFRDSNGAVIPFEASAPVRVTRGERFENEMQMFEREDGSQWWAMVSGSPIRGPSGEVEFGLVAAVDVTQLRDLQVRTDKMLTELSWSQHNWKRLIDNMTVGVILLDSELRVLQANRAYSRQFGAAVKLRRGVSIGEVLPRAEESGILSLLRGAIESERPVSVKSFRYDGLPGGTTYWNGSAVPVRIHGRNGVETGLAMVLADVTEEINARERLAEVAALREKKAAELEAERARLDTIIQSAPIPIAVVGKDGRMLTCNSAARELAEVTAALDWAGGSTTRHEVPDVVITDSQGNELDQEDFVLARSLRGEVCAGETFRLRIGSRSCRALNINSAPLRDICGEITGVVLAVVDLTEQIRTQEHISEIYQREHMIAEKLQSSFLPSGCPSLPRFDIGERYHNALDEALVGGDFYDVFRLGEDRLGVVIADVAGKGLKAAVYTAMAKYMLRAYAVEDCEPGGVLAKLNEALTACTPSEVFVTLIYGILDGKDGVFRYANAGHEQPAFYSAADRIAVNLDVTGRALALLPGSNYTVCNVEMQPGDLLALYTDGITDAGRGAYRMGVDRLLRVIESRAARSADEIAEAIVSSALEFAGGNLTDDAALLIVKAI